MRSFFELVHNGPKKVKVQKITSFRMKNKSIFFYDFASFLKHIIETENSIIKVYGSSN